LSRRNTLGSSMVKRIGRSEKDHASLNRLLANQQIVEKSQPRDYRNKVVVKPWGYEFLIFENKFVAVWFLHIRKGHSTSMHCHPTKKTSLIVLSGDALCNTFNHRNYLNSMDAVIIESGVFHSTQSISTEGINLIEVESPPNKIDLVRLNDGYGREEQGYEGYSEMQSTDLERFGFFCLDAARKGASIHSTPGFSVSIGTFTNGMELSQWLLPENNSYYCVCKGQLLGMDGNVLLEVGDIEAGDVLSKTGINKQHFSEPVILLAMRKT